MAEAFPGDRVYRSAAAVPPPRGPRYVTIGKFDGVHLGHQAILRALVTDALAAGGEALAITFEPRPDVVLARLAALGRGEEPPPPPPRLSTAGEKVRRLLAAGVQRVLDLEFTAELAAIPAERFVREVLAAELRASGVYVGHDFTFGYRGAGTPALLAEMGPAVGFSTRVIGAVSVDGQVVSASSIRRLLAEGNVERAARCLGRPHLVSGTVERGAGRGRALGIPTANLAPDPELAVPAPGVYAAWAAVDPEGSPARRAAVNVGHRPTFGGGAFHVEAHLLDFAGDLYGRRMGLYFVARLRDERRHISASELVAQVRRDIARAADVLEGDFVASAGAVWYDGSVGM